MNNPEKTVVPTKEAIIKSGLSSGPNELGIPGINPFIISIGGGIIIKKFNKKLADMIATITAKARSKNCVFPFQKMKYTKLTKNPAKYAG